MMSSKGSALITGGSSGIGYELARLFARDGYDIVLVARGQPALEKAQQGLASQYGVRVTTMGKDLADPKAPQEVFDELEQQGVRVDVLVNSAGFGTYGEFADIDMAQELSQIQVNIVALTVLTKLFLRPMLRRRSGRVLNVASTAAFQPGPLMAVYYASKAYVLYLSEALSAELEGTGVTVTALCPGPTRSGFQARAGIQGVRLLAAGVMDAGDVARAGYVGLMNGKRVVVPGWHNQLIALAARLAPRGLTLKAAKWAQERNHAAEQSHSAG